MARGGSGSPAGGGRPEPRTGVEAGIEAAPWAAVPRLLVPLDRIGAPLVQLAWASAVEALADAPAPPRGRALRRVVAELARIRAHLAVVAGTLRVAGAAGDPRTSWRRALALLVDCRAGRHGATPAVAPGGLHGVDEGGLVAAARAAVRQVAPPVSRLLGRLEAGVAPAGRLRGVAPIPAGQARSLGLTGPTRRASGGRRDRRAEGDGAAAAAACLRAHAGRRGDVLDRVRQRLVESLQSLELIEVLLDGLPAGPAREPSPLPPPRGAVSVVVEVADGELGLHLASTGGPRPARVRWSPPSAVLAAARPRLARGLAWRDRALLSASLGPAPRDPADGAGSGRRGVLRRG